MTETPDDPAEQPILDPGRRAMFEQLQKTAARTQGPIWLHYVVIAITLGVAVSTVVRAFLPPSRIGGVDVATAITGVTLAMMTGNFWLASRTARGAVQRTVTLTQRLFQCMDIVDGMHAALHNRIAGAINNRWGWLTPDGDFEPDPEADPEKGGKPKLN